MLMPTKVDEKALMLVVLVGDMQHRGLMGEVE